MRNMTTADLRRLCPDTAASILGRPAKASNAPTSRYKSKLEARYANILEARQIAGEVIWWAYEIIRVRLADGTYYTPDFMVMVASGDIELHETKGFMREAARVRLRVAAELMPIRFLLVRSIKGRMTVEAVGGMADRIWVESRVVRSIEGGMPPLRNNDGGGK